MCSPILQFSPEQRGPSELWGDWLQSDEPSASDVRWSCQGSQNVKELFQQMYKCKSTGVIYFPAICVPEVPPSSQSVHRVMLLMWDWHLRWAVQLKEILITSVWFVPFLTISVQINSLPSQTMSQSVNRWCCGVHTHPQRSLRVMCRPVVLTPQTRWVGPATHMHHSVSSFPEELVLFWHAHSEWRFGFSLASSELYNALWYWWCV